MATIHFARLDKSPRLQRAIAKLREFPGGLTTKQWQSRANLCNAHTCAAELKAQGYRIECHYEGRGAGGSSIFRYELKEKK